MATQAQTVQQPLILLVPILDSDNVPKLEALLKQWGSEQTPDLDFGKSPRTHFARFVLLKAGEYYQTSNRLLFTANFDGDRRAYLDELQSELGGVLDRVWDLCDVPPAKSANFEQFVDAHSTPVNTFYAALPGVAAAQILAAAENRRLLDLRLDGQAPRTIPASSGPRISLPAKPVPNLASKLEATVSTLLERIVGVRPGRQDATAVIRTDTSLYEIEDLFVQNQMTVIVEVKPGLLSRLILRLVLFFVNQAAKRARGSLSGITTIHFARWVIIDDGDHLLFESNYDGSWESYIDDFVDSASLGMNLIWGNCTDFPIGGSQDVEAFKAYIRKNQIPSQLFYSAYRELTMPNILTDLGLSGDVAAYRNPNGLKQLEQGVYVRG